MTPSLAMTATIIGALAAACWYAWFFRAAPSDLRAEAKELRRRLDRLSARNAELSATFQRSVERLQLLAQTDRELTDRALDLEVLLSTLARRAALAVGEVAAVYLPEPGRPDWRAVAGAAPALRDEAEALFEAAVPDGDPSLARAAMEAGQPQAGASCGLQQALAVPLRSRAWEVIGALVLVRKAGAPPYGPEETALCEQIAERAASPLEVARLHRHGRAYLAIAARELQSQSRVLTRRLDEMDVARARQALERLDLQAAWLARLVNGEVEPAPPAEQPDPARSAPALH